MSLTVKDTLDIIERIAPARLAEQWDNVGLMIGDPSATIDSILIGLDPTLDLLDEAVSCGANLLITHHPFIFHPLKTVHLDNPTGIFFERAIRNNVNVVSSHTNLDSSVQGISYSLASNLGLEEIHPLEPAQGEEEGGMGCVGKYKIQMSAEEFLARLKDACSPPWLLVTPNRPSAIDCVAVCGGSGSELAPKARELGAQVYVTSEVKHSIARWAEETGLWIIDAGHFATENQALPLFAEQLAGESARQQHQVEIRVSNQQKPPLLMMDNI